MYSKIVIYGATSAIAVESAKIWASRKADLFLVARSKEKLEVIKNDLLTRGASSVIFEVADSSNVAGHETLFSRIKDQMPQVDIMLIAYGSLGDQKKCEETFSEAYKELNTNFLSMVSLLTGWANYFEQGGCGTIAVITSVAGDRGRKSNYVYGCAKGALSIYLQGLRNRLGKTNIAVIDIKPGLTDTPMTAHMKKGPLFSSATTVGLGVVNAIDRGKEIVYLPWFWRIIMFIICLIPEKIFKNLSV